MKNNLTQLIDLTSNSHEFFEKKFSCGLDWHIKSNVTEKFWIDTGILTAYMCKLAHFCVSFKDRETFILNIVPTGFHNSKSE